MRLTAVLPEHKVVHRDETDPGFIGYLYIGGCMRVPPHLWTVS